MVEMQAAGNANVAHKDVRTVEPRMSMIIQTNLMAFGVYYGPTRFGSTACDSDDTSCIGECSEESRPGLGSGSSGVI